MKIQMLLTAAVTMLLMSAGAAYAITVSPTVSYTVTPSGASPSWSSPTIHDDLTTPLSLTVGTPISKESFFTTDPAGSSCRSNVCEATATLTLQFTFTGLGTVVSGATSETATYEAQYENYGNTKLACTGLTGNTDCVLWGNTTLGTQSITDTIDFSSGNSLLITLYNAEDWDITTDISFNLSGPTATPLPPALSLFAGGLGIFGFLGARRKRKATTAVA